jgi:hypothetical protein
MNITHLGGQNTITGFCHLLQSKAVVHREGRGGTRK